MLQSNVLLYNITKDKKYLIAAQRQAYAGLKHFYKKNLFPDNYWLNTVLLRGYVELYRVDKINVYIKAFKSYANKVWRLQKNNKNLIGKHSFKSLRDQAGCLEMLVPLQNL